MLTIRLLYIKCPFYKNMGAHEGLLNIRLIKILKQISAKNLKQNSRAKPEPAAV